MNTQKKRRVCRNIIAGLAITVGAVATGNEAVSQDFGKAITDAAKNSVINPQSANPSNPGAAVSGQSASERGVNRAVQGALRGESTGDALRSGLREGVQTATETPQQRLQRDQLQAQQAQGGAFNTQGTNTQGNSQTWQRDSQGRFFYQNANGQAVYADSANQQSSQGRTANGSDGQVQQRGGQRNGQMQAVGTSVFDALVKKYKSANEAEIELAEMAKNQSKNEDVRELASKLVDDHRMLNQELEKLSMTARSSSSAMQSSTASQMLPEQWCEISEQACKNSLQANKKMLSSYEGQAFDMAFLGQQCAAHTMMIAELEAVRDAGPSELQSFTAEAVKKAQSHQREAKQLADKLASATQG